MSLATRLFGKRPAAQAEPVEPYVPPPYDPSRSVPDDETVQAVADRYGIDDLDIVRLLAVADVMIWPGVASGEITVFEGPWARIAYVLAQRDERLDVPEDRRTPFRTPLVPEPPPRPTATK